MSVSDAGAPQRPATAIVMGAASGAALRCARLLSSHGVQLVLADADGPALRAIARELDCLGRYCDVASEPSVAIFATEMRTVLPSVDLLINGGGSGYVRTLGMLRASKALMPRLRAGDTGSCILNLAPADEAAPSGGLFRHATSADGFIATSRAMAAQAPDGLRILTCREPTAERLVSRLIGRLAGDQARAA